MILLNSIQDNQLENIWITICIHLFILSLISERIVNFIKLNFQKLYEGKLFEKNRTKKIENVFGNFRDKKGNEKDEKLRERGILNWAIVCSFFVALMANADLFYLLKNGKLPEGNDETISYLGIVLTTFFLSLGSKFWHDLLDLLFQIKNLKSKLSDVSNLELNNINELDELIALSKQDSLNRAIDEKINQFRKEGVKSVILKHNQNTDYLEVGVETNDVNVETELKFLHNGLVKKIPIKKKINTEVETQELEPSDRIGSTRNTKMEGSLGGLVKYKDSNESYFLTCYHVLKSSEQNWANYQKKFPDEQVESPEDSTKIVGEIMEAKRNATVDIAIIKPNTSNISSEIPEIGKVLGHRLVSQTDVQNKTVVQKNGKTTGLRSGRITGIAKSIAINYSDGGTHTLFDLIEISPINIENPFSKKGDSGSLVVDEDGFAVGIVVAGTKSNNKSYAIPIDTIFDQFYLEIQS